jgi:hypothetical protein
MENYRLSDKYLEQIGSMYTIAAGSDVHEEETQQFEELVRIKKKSNAKKLKEK